MFFRSKIIDDSVLYFVISVLLLLFCLCDRMDFIYIIYLGFMYQQGHLTSFGHLLLLCQRYHIISNFLTHCLDFSVWNIHFVLCRELFQGLRTREQEDKVSSQFVLKVMYSCCAFLVLNECLIVLLSCIREMLDFSYVINVKSVEIKKILDECSFGNIIFPVSQIFGQLHACYLTDILRQRIFELKNEL